MFANAWLAISLNPQSLVFSKWSKSNHCINYSAWFEQNNNKHQHKHLPLTSWFHQKPTMLFRVLLKNNLNLWCNQCEATKRFPESMTTRFGSVATIRHSRYTTQNGVANPCSLCSLVWTQIFFFFQTIREKHPWKDLWPTVRREISIWCLDSQNTGKSQAGSVWVCLGGVARLSLRILCPAPLHFIHKTNQENQHFTLSLFFEYKLEKKLPSGKKQAEWTCPLVGGDGVAGQKKRNLPKRRSPNKLAQMWHGCETEGWPDPSAPQMDSPSSEGLCGLSTILPAHMHVRVKRALHVHGANSFRPFQLTPPKGKVAGRERRRGKREAWIIWVCEEWAFEWISAHGGKVRACVCNCVQVSMRKR